jgi:hypothetical protein
MKSFKPILVQYAVESKKQLDIQNEEQDIEDKVPFARLVSEREHARIFHCSPGKTFASMLSPATNPKRDESSEPSGRSPITR